MLLTPRENAGPSSLGAGDDSEWGGGVNLGRKIEYLEQRCSGRLSPTDSRERSSLSAASRDAFRYLLRESSDEEFERFIAESETAAGAEARPSLVLV